VGEGNASGQKIVHLPKKKTQRFKIPMNSLSYYPKIDCSEKAAAK
jgi:hypothetical protein